MAGAYIEADNLELVPNLHHPQEHEEEPRVDVPRLALFKPSDNILVVPNIEDKPALP